VERMLGHLRLVAEQRVDPVMATPGETASC
jgi:hypothetical protein